MKYFTLRNRTAVQIILLTVGILGTCFILNDIVQKGVQKKEQIGFLILSILSIWSATAPSKEGKDKKDPKIYEDILDSDIEN